MAIVARRWTGAECGGLDELVGSVGTPTAISSDKKSGDYCYQLDAGEAITTSGGGSTSALWQQWKMCHFKITDVTPAAQILLLGGDTDVLIDTNGDVLVRNGFSTIVLTITRPALAILSNTWHHLCLYVNPGSGSAGQVEVFIDGVSIGADLTVTLTTTEGWDSGSQNGTSSGATLYIDNIVILEDTSGLSATSDFWLDAEALPYFSTKTGLTPDTGSVADAGAWVDACVVPFASSSQCQYDSTGAGSVYTNDAGGSGSGGPSGDTNLTGTVEAIKGSWLMERGNGGASDHYGLLGNNGDGTTRTVDFDPATSPAQYFEMYSNSVDVVPIPSEYCNIGFETTGAQNFECWGMLAQILHVPAAAISSLPPIDPLGYFRHLITQ